MTVSIAAAQAQSSFTARLYQTAIAARKQLWSSISTSSPHDAATRSLTPTHILFSGSELQSRLARSPAGAALALLPAALAGHHRS
jgi:hypothetical protein